MVKFRLKGSEANSFPLKVKKEVDVERIIDGKVVKQKETQTVKTHIKGGVEHDSNNFNMSMEEIKSQLGADIEWIEEKKEEEAPPSPEEPKEKTPEEKIE